MKRFCIAALLAVGALVSLNPPAHAFGIMGSWWNLDNTDVDGWGGGIRQEIPLLPWGRDKDDEKYTTTTQGDSVVVHEHDEGDLEAEDSLFRLSLDTRASFFRFSDVIGEGGDLNIIPLEVGALLGLGVLYAEVGGGYYIFDADFDAENAWGWFGLAGVMIGRGTKGLFGEIKWTALSTDIDNVDPDFDDIPTSVDADGMGFNVGISFGI